MCCAVRLDVRWLSHDVIWAEITRLAAHRLVCARPPRLAGGAGGRKSTTAGGRRTKKVAGENRVLPAPTSQLRCCSPPPSGSS